MLRTRPAADLQAFRALRAELIAAGHAPADAEYKARRRTEQAKSRVRRAIGRARRAGAPADVIPSAIAEARAAVGADLVKVL